MYLWQLESQMDKLRERRRVVLCSDEQMETKIAQLLLEYGVAGLYKIRVNPLVPPDEVWVIRTSYWESIE